MGRGLIPGGGFSLTMEFALNSRVRHQILAMLLGAGELAIEKLNW